MERDEKIEEPNILSTMVPEWTTARLTLRRLAASDARTMFAYRSLPEVARYQQFVPATVEAVQEFITQYSSGEVGVPGTWFQPGIVLSRTGELVGDCGMHFPRENESQAEVGITLAPAHQGRGYAAETLEKVLDVLFCTMGKHRVIANVDPRNAASIALVSRIGMRKEGHFRKSIWAHGEWTDNLLYAILEEEWKNRLEH